MALKDDIREQILDIGYTLYPYCSCSHDTARLCEGHRKLVERATALVSKALQEAERRVEGEKVDAEATGDEGDIAYNLAIEHSLKSLRELREGLK